MRVFCRGGFARRGPRVFFFQAVQHLIAPIIAEYALARHQPRQLKRLYDRREEMMQLLKDEHAKATAE